MKTGVIVLGHGSRAEKVEAIFEKIVQQTRRKVDYDLVKKASMEFVEPNLAQTTAQMVEAGMKKIIIIPLFLFPGVHIQRDIPRLIEELEENYPQIEFVFARNLGAHEKIAEVIVERIKEVI